MCRWVVSRLGAGFLKLGCCKGWLDLVGLAEGESRNVRNIFNVAVLAVVPPWRPRDLCRLRGLYSPTTTNRQVAVALSKWIANPGTLVVKQHCRKVTENLISVKYLGNLLENAPNLWLDKYTQNVGSSPGQKQRQHVKIALLGTKGPPCA